MTQLLALKSLRKNVGGDFETTRIPFPAVDMSMLYRLNIIIEIVLDMIKRPESYTVMPNLPSATVIAGVRQSSCELCLGKQDV